MPGQLSFFTAGMHPPAVDDLDGLLLGLAQLVRLGGTARLSVLVDQPWRVEAVLSAYGDRGLRGAAVATGDGATTVRTPFTKALLPAADRWVRGAIKSVPPGFALDGPRLRMWAIGAGRRDEHGYLFRLSPHDPAVWEPAGAALAAYGLTATFLGPRADGPAYRVTGRRRTVRLREFVGEPPDGAADTDWPG